MTLQLPSGPRAQLLMTRILRLCEQSGMHGHWAALHLLNVAFLEARRSKFPDFDFRRVFEMIWVREKASAREPDTLDEAISAWSITRESDAETLAAELARALVVQARQGKIPREDIHAAIDQFFAAAEPGEPEAG